METAENDDDLRVWITSAKNRAMVQILPVNNDSLAQAARRLSEGGLVAFPTETVYGLGADATNDIAVARIFEAKNRPSFNPLIVHFPSIEDAWTQVRPNTYAMKIAEAFWPGAITFVLPLSEHANLASLVSAGLPTAAVRVPSDGRARRLLKNCCFPIAAPSANRSGSISPTTAEHVARSLGDNIDLILDGGPCTVGLESTIIDLSTERPRVLRAGGVTSEELAKVLGFEPEASEIEGQSDKALKSPGLMRSHYAPNAIVRLNVETPESDEAYLSFGESAPPNSLNLSETYDLREAAGNLFAHLHTLDADGANVIAVAPIPEIGLGRAINDRLRRAAAPKNL